MRLKSALMRTRRKIYSSRQSISGQSFSSFNYALYALLLVFGLLPFVDLAFVFACDTSFEA